MIAHIAWAEYSILDLGSCIVKSDTFNPEKCVVASRCDANFFSQLDFKLA